MKKRPNYIESVSDTLMENQSTETLIKKEPTIPKEKSKEENIKVPLEIKEPIIKKTSKLPGRPKGIPKKQYSIYIPEEMIPEMTAPLQYYQGDISKYLIKLINDDLKRNKEAYKQLMNISIK